MEEYAHLGLRVLILIATVCLIYFAIEDEYRQHIPFTLMMLLILILSERFVSTYKCVENMRDTGTSDATNVVEGFDRKDRLEWLNANRGQLGQFYVACRGCGRKKILQERVKSLYDTPPCHRYQTVGPCEGTSSGCSGCNASKSGNSEGCCNNCKCGSNCNCGNGKDCGCGCRTKSKSGCCDDCKCGSNCRCGDGEDCGCGCAFRETQRVVYEDGCGKCNSANNDGGSHKSYCIKDCADNIGRDTVSLWNDGYIDIDQIFCYNCMLDLKSKVLREARTYRELPPVNGPPGYSVYRDRGY